MPTRTADDQYTVGELRAELARQNRTQSDLAVVMGEQQSWVSRRMTGDVAITVADLLRFAAALGIPVARLLPPEDM